MLHILNTVSQKKVIISFLTLFTFCQLSYSQEILGISEVEPNVTYLYTFDNGLLHMGGLFHVDLIDGEIESQGKSPRFASTNYFAYVKWNPVGTGSISFKKFNNVLATLNVTIAGVAPEISDENYIYTVTPRTETTDVSQLSNNEKNEQITYYDGLGRPMQGINVRGGGQNQDLITHITYDNYGRQDKDYLPYIRNTSSKSYEDPEAPLPSLEDNIKSYYEAKYPADMEIGNSNPYSQKLFEESPLNRVLEQAAPGKDWLYDDTNNANSTIKFEYKTNTGTEVKKFEVGLTYANNTYTPSLVYDNNDSHYTANQLYKTISKDENWQPTQTDLKNHTTEEFKDTEGRVILKRTYNDGIHDTYYVYDTYGNLSYVLSPEASDNIIDTNNNIATDVLNNLCYQYKYDHRNRLVEKKIPGKDWEYIIYNKLDQPILTQHANQRAVDQWLFTKYDTFGRIAYIGITEDPGTRATIQTNVNNSNATQYETKSSSASTIANTTIYYSNGAHPTTTILELHSINYYDDYTFDTDGLSLPATADGQAIINHDNNNPELTKSLSTGSKVRILETDDWITTLMGYDTKGRPIYIANKNNYLETTEVVINTFDFLGNVKKTETTHDKTGHLSIVSTDTFLYDDENRLLSHKNKVNNAQEQVIAENIYDELGQLVSKGVGGATSRLQTIDYTYNIRGWLKNINNDANNDNDLFNFTLMYNDIADSSKKLYNGNISQVIWNTLNTDSSTKTYTYTYDALNRITEAIDNTTNYNLNTVAYDKNGNILNLNRNGHTDANATTFGLMDDLTYTYTGNQLKKVDDDPLASAITGFKDGTNTGDDYTYDANGNMISDLNKGITDITYNHLNLPTKVSFGLSDVIEYVYDAAGVKLEKKVSIAGAGYISINGTLYGNNFIYDYIDGNGGPPGGNTQSRVETFKFIFHPEGYAEPSTNSYKYIYQYKDHLGNIRLSYSDTDNNGTIAQSEIIEENNYYPFGLRHKGYNNVINGTHHPYTFNGKEENEELGLNWLDFEERNYDAALGRWMNLDPLSELMTRHSPYNYAFDNPVYYIDPDGMMPFGADGLDGDDNNYDFRPNDGPQHITSTYVDRTGKIIKHIDDGDPNIYLVLNPSNGLNKDWIIGTERSGVTYTEGNHLDIRDLDEPYNKPGAALPSEFQINFSIDVESTRTDLVFWPAEILEGGGLFKIGKYWKYLKALNKYKKLAKNSKFMKQLIRQFEKDGSKSINKSYQKLLRRLKEHQKKLDGGLEYSSSVEREIRTFSQQIKELEIFMTKHKMKF